MKTYLISDNRDTMIGMRLAGIRGTVVDDEIEASELLDEILKDKEIGIVVITEKLAEKMRDKVNYVKQKLEIPLIVEVPDRHGSIKEPDYITGYVRDSIGIKIWGGFMITVEEKLKLFTKLVYDKIEKENQTEIDKYNSEYGNIIDEKKKEFEKQAEKMDSEKMKEIDKKKNQIISRAKVEEQKLLLQKKKEIFDEAVEEIKNYSKEFTNSEDYKELFLKSLKESMEDLKESKNISFYVIENDRDKFKKTIAEMYPDTNFKIDVDDNLIGGFTVQDEDNNIKIDMSLMSKIESSKEVIGEKLYSMLH